MHKPFIGLVALSILTACGGGTNAPNPQQPAPNPIPEAPQQPEQPQDPQDPQDIQNPEDEILDQPQLVPLPTPTNAQRAFGGSSNDFNPILSDNEDLITIVFGDDDKALLEVFGEGQFGASSVAYGEKDDVAYLAGVTSNGDASVGFVSGSDSNQPDGSPISYYVVERLADGSFPNTGSAQYSGSYVGNVGLVAFVAGDVTMDADFVEGSISGLIENRKLVNVDFESDIGATTSDVVLEASDIFEDGSFGGLANGGTLQDGDDQIAPNSATYYGLLAGQGASTAAGGLVMTYDLQGQELREVGTFIAE